MKGGSEASVKVRDLLQGCTRLAQRDRLGQVRRRGRACQLGEQHEQEARGRSESGRWDPTEGPGLVLVAMGQGPMRDGAEQSFFQANPGF